MNEKIEALVRALLGLVSPAWAEKYAATAAQFVKFGLVGISNSLVSYVLNVLVLLALRRAQVSWDYLAGNTVAFVLSVLWSFHWNSRYVFVDRAGTRSRGKALFKTYLSYGFTGILLNNVLSWLWITRLGISKYIAPLLNLVISVPLNFVLNKLWAFRSDDAAK